MKSAIYTVFLLVGVILGTLWFAALGPKLQPPTDVRVR